MSGTDFYWLEYTDGPDDAGMGNPLGARAVRHFNGDCKRLYVSPGRVLSNGTLEAWQADAVATYERPIAVRRWNQERA